jgi:hypothetical protein
MKACVCSIADGAGVIGSFKNKEVEGVNVFEQILPKEAKIAMPKDLLGDNTFAAEGGEMVREIDKQLGKKANYIHSRIGYIYKRYRDLFPLALF